MKNRKDSTTDAILHMKPALKTGMDGHLTKPIDTKELFETLAGVLKECE